MRAQFTDPAVYNLPIDVDLREERIVPWPDGGGVTIFAGGMGGEMPFPLHAPVLPEQMRPTKSTLEAREHEAFMQERRKRFGGLNFDPF